MTNQSDILCRCKDGFCEECPWSTIEVIEQRRIRRKLEEELQKIVDEDKRKAEAAFSTFQKENK